MLLSEKAYRLINEHITGAYPYEACGVLLTSTDDERIDCISQASNEISAHKAKERFFIDPVWFYGIEREAEISAKKVLGFYHSHPDKPPVLSKKDEEYMIPGMIYIIASVTGLKCKEIRGYLKKGADDPALEIEIVREAALI